MLTLLLSFMLNMTKDVKVDDLLIAGERPTDVTARSLFPLVLCLVYVLSFILPLSCLHMVSLFALFLGVELETTDTNRVLIGS